MMIDKIINIIFKEDATPSELLIVVTAFGILWYVVFAIGKRVLTWFAVGQPWLRDAIERDYERSTKKLLEDLGYDMTKEEALEFLMNDWPAFQVIYLQHFAGSFFCIPSIFNLMEDPATASSLAICGVLSEMGWELEDMMEVIYARMFLKDGKSKFPDASVALRVIHHSLTTFLGLPMIIYYRNSQTLHWLCFDLQFAGGLLLATIEYTKFLDISNHSHLRQFKALNFILLVVMLWTRLFHWVYLCYHMILTWYHDEAYIFLVAGSILSILFSFFNYIFCIQPIFKRFIKFLHVSAEYQSLPPNASQESRRQSVMKLETAVGDLMTEHEMADLGNLFLPLLFEKRKVQRRQTMPPQVGRRKRFSRASIRLMRALSVPAHIAKEKDT